MNLLKYEVGLFKKGYNVICGVDEVGVSPLAGPLVACAVAIEAENLMDMKHIRLGRYKINDSKQLPKSIRDKLYKRILGSVHAVGIGIVSVPELNQIRNVRKSGSLARYRAVQNLGRSNNYNCHIHWHPKDQNLQYASKFRILYTPIVPHYIILDGPFGMPEIKDIPIKSIIGGDRKSIMIASASIIAKVFRDNLMTDLDKIYPHYGWNTNMGYGTKYHKAMLMKYGITPYHRLHFKLVKFVLNKGLK